MEEPPLNICKSYEIDTMNFNGIDNSKNLLIIQELEYIDMELSSILV